jgi:hypothetical protein
MKEELSHKSVIDCHLKTTTLFLPAKKGYG